MKAATIIKDATAAGVRLTVSVAGKLMVMGERMTVNRWLPAIREQKAEILTALERVDESAMEVNAAQTDVSPSWWLFSYTGGGQKEVTYCPPATHAYAINGEPGAINAEPFEPIRRQPDEFLSEQEEAAILKWLARIGETDEETIVDVVQSCRIDADARQRFIQLAND